jgi:hypothetical protein
MGSIRCKPATSGRSDARIKSSKSRDAEGQFLFLRALLTVSDFSSRPAAQGILMDSYGDPKSYGKHGWAGHKTLFGVRTVMGSDESILLLT